MERSWGIPERIPSKDKIRTELNNLRYLKPGAGEILIEERQKEPEQRGSWGESARKPTKEPGSASNCCQKEEGIP